VTEGPARMLSYIDGGPNWAAPPDDALRSLDGAAFATGPGPFRAAMRHQAKGVAVITADADEPTGFCATSLSSLCLDPPLASFTVGLRSSSWPAVHAARHLMAHLLAQDQAGLAARFGEPAARRFAAPTRWHRDALGLPVLQDALAWLLLIPVSYLRAGDHVLVVARVGAVRVGAGGRPLVHHGGGFAGLAAAGAP
jgi:flavin reductase (DIM6/NTAB) family NADH-FMN oxidoreductase RutF